MTTEKIIIGRRRSPDTGVGSFRGGTSRTAGAEAVVSSRGSGGGGAFTFVEDGLSSTRDDVSLSDGVGWVGGGAKRVDDARFGSEMAANVGSDPRLVSVSSVAL